MGIAVGMATNIPPHNLCELVDAITCLIDNSDCTIEDLMKFVKGPDFPTGAEIYGISQIKNAYVTGKGSIVMRAVANIEEQKRGGFRIIVSEIPYQVNKSELLLKIADLVKQKKLEGISGLRDESDRTEGVRIVIDLRSNAYPKKILNRLYELTPMQSSFHVNMLALVDGIQPRILTLKNVLDEYIKHRQVVVRRRTEYELARAKERAHILEGLRIALAKIDEVVETIKKSQTRDDALKSLCKKFKLTEIQANAILDMRLAGLAALEVKKVDEEYKAKIAFIKECEEILASPAKILTIIKKELRELKTKFPSERRTKIYEQEIGKFSAEDLIPSEQVIVMLTKGNYIKRMPVSAYRSQIRGGKGVMGMETKEEDTIEHLCAANTHDDVLFFTDRGRAFQTKVYEIPQASRISKGQAIVNIIQSLPEEKVTAVVTLNHNHPEGLKYFVFATEKGVVKKTDIALYKNVRKNGIVAIKLSSDDKLRWVKTTSGADKIFMASAKGQAIFYNETGIRPMGRSAAGVRGILLKGEDKCIGIDVVLPSLESKAHILVVTENGFGKRTKLANFKVQLRGGMGMRVANVTTRTGKVIGMNIVYGAEPDVILATEHGQMIRMGLETIKVLSRDTQGVTLVKLHESDRVASVTVVTKTAEEIVQKVESKAPVVLVPAPEDRPVQEVPKLKEVDSRQEIKKEAKEIKDNQRGAESGKIPEWAKAHHDSWREPSVTKLDKKIKVKNYKNPKKNLNAPQQDLFSDRSAGGKQKNEDEPNYWGGQM
jgi:DNA gyrase subunit A